MGLVLGLVVVVVVVLLRRRLGLLEDGRGAPAAPAPSPPNDGQGGTEGRRPRDPGAGQGQQAGLAAGPASAPAPEAVRAAA